VSGKDLLSEDAPTRESAAEKKLAALQSQNVRVHGCSVTPEARMQIGHAQAELARLDILQAKQPDHEGIEISRGTGTRSLPTRVAETVEAA